MYSPKERCELFLSMLGEQLNEHGHFFKISKTRLSWRNKEAAVLITLVGDHYSEAEVTTRRICVRVDSYALRKLVKANAPISGSTARRANGTLFDRQIHASGSPSPTEVTLTDWWSIEQAAKHVASQLDDYWQDELTPWLSHETAITYLSTHPKQGLLSAKLLGSNPPEPGLTILFAADAPAADDPELEKLIHEHKLVQKEWPLRSIGELLLASNRDRDFWRIVKFSSMYQERSQYMNAEHHALMALANWKQSNTQ